MTVKKWNILSERQDFSSEKEIIDELISLRGIEDPKDFFNPTIDSLSIENSRISKLEVEETIKRINQSIDNNETIIIFGDYDVDGICASAILWEVIYKKYKNVYPYLPDRFHEGYGISKNAIDNLLEKYPKTKLIITVDNGIVAHEAVEHAREKGIDVIVTDHHVASSDLPNSYAIVHTTELCGAGVAWMLAHALGFESQKAMHEKLELAALATVADLVPLTGLNRVIVKNGLKYLRETKRIGLNELFKVAGIEKEKIDTYHIGFMIGPRLNATGRISHAKESLRLLCSSDRNYAIKTARILDETNRMRQEMVKKSSQHAKLSVLKEEVLRKVILVHHKTYSEGIIGLVASRLVEEYSRPVLAISVGERISKGSARSVRGVNIIELIRKHSTHLTAAGGHPMAAGFSIETEKILAFKADIENSSDEIIADDALVPELVISMTIPLSLVTLPLYMKIEKFSPFGMGNPKPIFLTKDVVFKRINRLGKDGAHLRLIIEKDGTTISAIAFGMGDRDISLEDKADIVFSIEVNEWKGKKDLELRIKDFKLLAK